MKTMFHREVIQLVVCALMLCCTVPATAQDDKISLNFVNADIPEVIRAVSSITGRNFLVDPRVKGTINIVSAHPVAPGTAYDILLSALRLQGYATVETNGVTKVMPEADAKLYIGEVNAGQGRKDQIVTRVYTLKYESAAQLVNIIRPLIAPNNTVVAYPNTNMLVVTDYASNLKRIEQIISAIDQPKMEAPVIIPVINLSAVDLAQTITRLMQDTATPSTDGGSRFVLLAEARSNSLLLRSDNPDRIARVRELVKNLDIKSSAPGGMHVIYLKNAEAAKVAQTLRAVMSGDVSTPNAASTSAAPINTPASPNTSGGGVVQADQASNALIITAPEAVYNNLRAVVDMLDVRRAQVYVEALIAEVQADKAAEFGIQWQGAAGSVDGTLVAGGTNFGTGNTNITNVAAGIVNKTPALSPGLNIGLLRGESLGVLARALETESNANILSSPNLLTLDNEEAKIVIGQNVPFITGSYAQTGSTTTPSPFQTIERKDVGLTLRIKPQISEGGTVKMEIHQEVSSVVDKSLTNAAGIITNKRSLDSSVLVDEGQIIVLGGLIQDQVSNGESRVPLLGSIPFLGALFRYETRQHTKTNLMVFIRPYVLRNKNAANSLTQDRYEYLRTEQSKSQLPWRIVLPDMPVPLLPPLDTNIAKQATPAVASDNIKKTEANTGNSTAAPATPAATPSSAESTQEASPTANADAATGTVSGH